MIEIKVTTSRTTLEPWVFLNDLICPYCGAKGAVAKIDRTGSFPPHICTSCQIQFHLEASTLEESDRHVHQQRINKLLDSRKVTLGVS